jgi:hypothetical protein
MHATADTQVVIYLQSGGAARDARRWAASGVTEISGVDGSCPHKRKELRIASGAWFSSSVCGAACELRRLRAPRCFRVGSPPNKRMHPTADTTALMLINGAARRVMRSVSWLCGAAGMNSDKGEDRAEWERVWRQRPLRRLVNPPQIDLASTTDHAWGRVMRVDVVADPPQFVDSGWRVSEMCPICGEGASRDCRIAATLYPYFESGFSYGLACWVHEPCLASCEEAAGSAPVPW